MYDFFETANLIANPREMDTPSVNRLDRVADVLNYTAQSLNNRIATTSALKFTGETGPIDFNRTSLAVAVRRTHLPYLVQMGWLDWSLTMPTSWQGILSLASEFLCT